MIAGCDRAAHAVEQMLTLARLAPDAVSFQPTSVELDAILRETISELASAALAKRIDIELTHDGRVFVCGDAGLLAILFRNLLDNAIRYSPPATIVRVQIETGDVTTLIRIRDAGPGLSAEQQANIGRRLSGTRYARTGEQTGPIDRPANPRSAPRHDAARFPTTGVGLEFGIELPRMRD